MVFWGRVRSGVLILLSVVAVMAACFSPWFEWQPAGALGNGQHTGLGQFLATVDFSPTAAYGTATPADAETVRRVGWTARVVVAVLMAGALVGLARALMVTSSRARWLLGLVIGFTVLGGVVLLLGAWWGPGLYDVEYLRIEAGSPLRFTHVLPQGPVLLVLAFVLQAIDWGRRGARAPRG